MAIYRNKETGDLVDAWMHSKEEDNFTSAFPNWLHKIWVDGLAYTNEDGTDWLKTPDGDVEIPNGALIVRGHGGTLSIAPAEDFNASHLYEA